MLTLTALLLASAAPDANSSAAVSATRNNPTSWQCSTGRNRLQEQESRESWDQIKAMKMDGRAAVSKEAQRELNKLTEMLEQGDSRYSQDMAEMMREFAGGKAERRTKC